MASKEQQKFINDNRIELRALNEAMSLVKLKSECDLIDDYVNRKKHIINFSDNDCFLLPDTQDENAPRLNRYSNDVLIRLIGMIERKELILNDEVCQEN